MLLINPSQIKGMNRTILEEGDTYDGNDGFAVDFDEIDNTTSPNKT